MFIQDLPSPSFNLFSEILPKFSLSSLLRRIPTSKSSKSQISGNRSLSSPKFSEFLVSIQFVKNCGRRRGTESEQESGKKPPAAARRSKMTTSNGDGDAGEGEWRAASFFLAKGPSATLQYLVEDARAHLFAYKAQALDGDCPPGQDGSLTMDLALRKRQEAWKALNGMSRKEAKSRFVDLLTQVLPEWKKWCDEHAPRALKGEEHESEADKLLKAFRKRMAAGSLEPVSRL